MLFSMVADAILYLPHGPRLVARCLSMAGSLKPTSAASLMKFIKKRAKHLHIALYYYVNIIPETPPCVAKYGAPV